MSKATESMFDGKNVLIPLEEVSYVLKFQNCIEVRFKDSANSLTLAQPDKNAFISAWCRYRGEVEADTLMDLDGAQPAPSIPEGWLRAIDEALVVAHIGVANASDTYEQAKAKLDSLIGFHVAVATDPAVNGGRKLVPINPTESFYKCFSAYDGTSYSNPFDYDDFVKDWREALAAAPEVDLIVGAEGK